MKAITYFILTIILSVSASMNAFAAVELQMDDIVAKPGEIFTTDVSMNDQAPALRTVEIDIAYDADALEFQSGEIVDGEWLFSVIGKVEPDLTNLQSGQIKILLTASPAGGIEENTAAVLAKLTFEVSPDADPASISLTFLPPGPVLRDPDNNDIAYTPSGGSITIIPPDNGILEGHVTPNIPTLLTTTGDGYAETDESGHYQIFHPPGDFILTALPEESELYKTYTSEFTINEGETTVADVKLIQFPDVSMLSPASDITVNEGESVSFQGNAAGGKAPLSYSWDFSGGAANSDVQSPGNIIFQNAGTYPVTFKVTDADGDTDSAAITVTVVKLGELVASIISPVSNITINEGESVSFQGSAAGGKAPMSYSWDFSGGAANSDAQSPGNIIFQNAGTYPITFSVTDADGNTDSAAITVTVVKLGELVASITSPASNITINEGESVSFQGSAAGGKAPMSYLWDFSGGVANSQAQSPGNIVFQNAGTYPVIFSVTDAEGNTSSAGIRVTVVKESGTNTYTISAAASPGGTISPSGTLILDEGANQTFIISPDAGYFLDTLTDNGEDKSSEIIEVQYVLNDIRADHEIVATFAHSDILISAIAIPEEGGIIKPSGETTFPYGSDATFKITVNAGWIIEKVKVDDEKIDLETALDEKHRYVFENLTENHTIKAVFKKIHTISAFVSEGQEAGAITPSGQIAVEDGADQEFAITRNTGYEDWNIDVTADGLSLGDRTTYTFQNVGADHEISVAFKEPAPDYGTIEGNVTPNVPTILTTTRGFRAETDENGHYTMPHLPGDFTLKAKADNYKPYSIPVTVNAGETTQLDIRLIAFPAASILSPSANVIINSGAFVNFQGNVDGGNAPFTYSWDFNGGAVNAAVKSPGNIAFSTPGTYTVTFTVSDADGDTDSRSVTVTVNEIVIANTYTISASAGSNGNIFPSGDITVAEGENYTFTMVPDSGYEVYEIMADGQSIGALRAYTFMNVMGDHSLYVSFKKISESTKITPTWEQGGEIKMDGQQVIIIADPGYEVADVLIDGVSVGSLAAYTFPDDGGQHTVHASFKVSPVTVASGDNGTVTVTVNDDNSQTVTIIPDPGYQVGDVVADGVSVGSIDSYTFPNDGNPHDVQVTFTKPTSVTPSWESGGEIKLDGRQVLIIADPGYEVADVLIDGVSVGSVAAYIFPDDGGEHTVHAVFKPSLISAESGENGTVTVTVNDDNSQTVTIIPAPGYQVSDVVADGVSVGIVDSYTFPDDGASHTLYVSFTKPLEITPIWGPGGQIKVQGQDVFIIADPGYEVEAVTADGIVIGSVATYTFPDGGSHTITAAFKESLITAESGENGRITVTGNEDGTRTVTLLPDAGYEIFGLIADGVSLGPLDSYTFPDDGKVHTIYAVFKSSAVAAGYIEGTVIPNIPMIVSTSAGAVTETDENGYFALPHIPGEFVLTIQPKASDQYQVYTTEVTVISGEKTEPDISLIPACDAIAAFTASPMSGDATLAVTFDMKGSTGDLVLEFGDGGATIATAAEFITHEYEKPGEFQATLTATDPAGCTDIATQTVIISDAADSEPAVSIVSPLSDMTITAGESLEFQGNVAGGNAPFAYSWDFNGGAVNTALKSPGNVVFETPGTYTVRFTVTDADGDTDTASVTVTVNPAAVKSYTITASSGENGTISPEGEIVVNEGSSQTFIIEPDHGAIVHDVLADGESVGAMTSYTFTNITASHTIHAEFFRDGDPYTIVATSAENGTIMPAGDIVVPEGQSMTFTMQADPGYEIADVLIDGESAGALDSYTFTGISADHKIHLIVRKIQDRTYIEGTVTPNIPAVLTTTGGGHAETDDAGYYRIQHPAGEYVLTVKAKDSDQYKVYTANIAVNEGETSRFDIQLTEFPVASIVSPASDITVDEGESVYFEGAASGGTEPYSYSWDFGGGAENAAVNIPGDVVFQTPGDYTVTFTITDADGDTAVASVNVSVAEKSSSGGGGGCFISAMRD
jgi:PKD repeat protein